MPARREVASCSGTAITKRVMPATRSAVAQSRRYPWNDVKTAGLRTGVIFADQGLREVDPQGSAPWRRTRSTQLNSLGREPSRLLKEAPPHMSEYPYTDRF